VIYEDSKRSGMKSGALLRGETLITAEHYLSFYYEKEAVVEPESRNAWTKMTMGWRVALAIGLSAAALYLFYYLHLSWIP
jgi:hypothetical protein